MNTRSASIHTLLVCGLSLCSASAALASRERLKIIEQDALKLIPKVKRDVKWELPLLPPLPPMPGKSATLSDIAAARQSVQLQQAQLRAQLKQIDTAISHGANLRMILLIIEKDAGQRERGTFPAFLIGPYLDSLRARMRVLERHKARLNEKYEGLIKKKFEALGNKNQRLTPQPQQ